MKQANSLPTSTIVLLIRHGQTPTTGKVLPGRTPGLHLAKAGEEQAKDVAQRLDGLDLQAIYASPMERAQETAAPSSASNGLEIQLHQGLIECDFGEWTGQNLTELNKLEEWKEVQHSPSTFRFPAGESFVEMQERMLRAVAEIAHKHRGGVVAAFSHADTIKAVVASYLGTGLDHFQKVHVDTASISAVEFSGENGESARMLVTNSRTGSLAYLRPKELDPKA